MTKKARKRLTIAAAVVVATIVYFGFVFPTGEFLAEGRQLRNAQNELLTLQRTNKRLQATVNQYENPQYLDKLAREDFGLVKPGEFSYQIMPGSPLYVPPNGKVNSPPQLPNS